jgi:MGT family glycosyltransferase
VKILIASTAVLGHINPLLSVARIFRARGHEVIFQTASVFRDRVEQSGVTFMPFLPGADTDWRDLDAALPELKHIKPGPEIDRFLSERVFIDAIPHQDAGLRAILRDWPADAIIADTTFFGVVPLLLGPATERPSIVNCGITCLLIERDDGAPWGLGLMPATTDAHYQEYAAIRAERDTLVTEPVQRHFNGRLATLGLPPSPVSYLSSTAMLSDMYLHPTVPSFEYAFRHMPACFHFIGALPMPSAGVELPDWAGDIDGSRRVVLVTQGTVANRDLAQVIAPTLAALADEPDVLVLATTGGRPVEAIPGPIPANARLAKFLPYDWLLPKVEIVVTNGGYGTVSHALELGIPVVVAGLTEDKAEISARVAWSGVGVNLATNNPTPEALRQAVRDVLDKPQYRERAAVLAREFAQYDAESDIVRLVGEAAAAAAERRARAGAV